MQRILNAPVTAVFTEREASLGIGAGQRDGGVKVFGEVVSRSRATAFIVGYGRIRRCIRGVVQPKSH
jgi:hypothetical protein